MISIWAVLEHNGTQFHELSAELLGELREIVQRQQAPAELCAIVLAARSGFLKAEVAELKGLGVKRVYWLEHEALEQYGMESYVEALAWLMQRSKPDLIATGATARGRDWAPRLAARLYLPFIANCLSCNLQDDVLWSLQSLY